MQNKNALFRYEVLNECLSSRDGFTIDALVDACNGKYRDTPGMEGVCVRKRQVLNDLAAMQEIYKVTILKEKDPQDGRKVRFSYPEGAKDIHGDILLDKDYDNLRMMLGLLESMVDFPYMRSAAEALKKKMQDGDGGNAPVFAPDINRDLQNFKMLGPLIDDIRRKLPLRITYNAHWDKEKVLWFQPYYLKQYNNRWFLFGWDYDRELKDGGKGALSNLAVDRILAREHSRTFYQEHSVRPNDIDFEHFFDDIIGVTHPTGGKVEHIVLKIHDCEDGGEGEKKALKGLMDWNRLRSKPLHKSQRLNEEDHTMTLDLMPNNELYSTLSQFEHLEVLSPAYVRDRYIERIRTILECHEGC